MGILKKRLTTIQTNFGSAHFFRTWSESALRPPQTAQGTPKSFFLAARPLPRPAWAGWGGPFLSRPMGLPTPPGHPPPDPASGASYRSGAAGMRKSASLRVERCREGAGGAPGGRVIAGRSWAKLPGSHLPAHRPGAGKAALPPFESARFTGANGGRHVPPGRPAGPGWWFFPGFRVAWAAFSGSLGRFGRIYEPPAARGSRPTVPQAFRGLPLAPPTRKERPGRRWRKFSRGVHVGAKLYSKPTEFVAGWRPAWAEAVARPLWPRTASGGYSRHRGRTLRAWTPRRGQERAGSVAARARYALGPSYPEAGPSDPKARPKLPGSVPGRHLIAYAWAKLPRAPRTLLPPTTPRGRPYKTAPALKGGRHPAISPLLGQVTRKPAAGPFQGPGGTNRGPPEAPERCPATPRGDPDCPPYRPWGLAWVPDPARRVLVYGFHFRKTILYGDF